MCKQSKTAGPWVEDAPTTADIEREADKALMYMMDMMLLIGELLAKYLREHKLRLQPRLDSVVCERPAASSRRKFKTTK